MGVCTWVSLLVAAAAVYMAYDVTYGPLSTNQLLVEGFYNRARNHAALRAFAAELYGAAGQEYLAGKTIVITGTTSGLGEGLAAHLYEAAPASTTLVLPVRSTVRHTTEAVAARLGGYGSELRRTFAPGTVGLASSSDEQHPRVIVVQQDLSDLDSVDASVRSLREDHGVSRVDVLVNNAGLAPIVWKLTAQGFDLAMGVNHFGTAHFTLALNAAGLLGGDSSSGGDAHPPRARVVMVSSEEHRLPEKRFDEQPHAFGAAVEHGMGAAMERYAESKLALTTFAEELAERWADSVTVYDICPGPVASSIAQSTPVIGPLVVWLMDLVFPSRHEAALPVLRLALDPAYESVQAGGGGEVHHHMAEPRRAGALAVDKVHRRFVFDRTVELLESRGPPPAASSPA